MLQLLSENIHLVPATVTFLEMHDRPAESRKGSDQMRFEKLVKPIDAETYRRYYYGVGEKHNWLDRMVMPDAELLSKINSDNTDIFLMYVNDELAGFAEFVSEKDFTEIQYFGLFPNFVGKGFGKIFLEWVIQTAWSYHPKWIQLNTCTLDHGNALPVYQKAGFTIVKTEQQERKMLVEG